HRHDRLRPGQRPPRGARPLQGVPVVAGRTRRPGRRGHHRRAVHAAGADPLLAPGVRAQRVQPVRGGDPEARPPGVGGRGRLTARQPGITSSTRTVPSSFPPTTTGTDRPGPYSVRVRYAGFFPPRGFVYISTRP